MQAVDRQPQQESTTHLVTASATVSSRASLPSRTEQACGQCSGPTAMPRSGLQLPPLFRLRRR